MIIRVVDGLEEVGLEELKGLGGDMETRRGVVIFCNQSPAYVRGRRGVLNVDLLNTVLIGVGVLGADGIAERK